MPKITERGIHIIKQWERFRAKPYHDVSVMSIGFGHSSLMEPAFTAGDTWTIEHAEEVLRDHDIPYFEKLILPHLTVDIRDELYSGIISIGFNKGAGRLVRSEEWKILHDTTDTYRQDNFAEAMLHYAVAVEDHTTHELTEKRGLRWRMLKC